MRTKVRNLDERWKTASREKTMVQMMDMTMYLPVYQTEIAF
jgi:hypothetical protein